MPALRPALRPAIRPALLRGRPQPSWPATLAILVGIVAFIASLLIWGCASVAPGHDPIVVNAERVLKIAPSVYDGAMTFAHENPALLGRDAAIALETFRTAFPPLYRSADHALEVYKATKTGDVSRAVAELERALVDANGVVVACGGPALLGGAR